MTVFNGERYLREAIQSILDQTYTNFFFLIVDDCSSDRTPKLLRSYNDERIQVITNKRNLGVTDSLNIGLTEINTEYIARMDADDISLPERLEEQMRIIEGNKNASLVVNSYYLIDESGRETGISAPSIVEPIEDFYCGPSMFMKKECVQKAGNYRSFFKYSQDYDLYLRLLEEGEVLTIVKPLYKHRRHSSSISTTKRQEQRLYYSLAMIMSEQRKRCGKDILWGKSGKTIDSIREEIFGLPDKQKKKILSSTYATWGHAACRVGRNLSALEFAIKSLGLYPCNYRAWLIILKIIPGIIGYLKEAKAGTS